MHAHTSPMLSGLLVTVSASKRAAVVSHSTHMGVLYVFKRSLPLRFALTKVGPRAGTKYIANRKANMDSPTETYSAGREGARVIRGRAMNQDATGTRDAKRAGGRDRGAVAFGIVNVGPIQRADGVEGKERVSPTFHTRRFGELGRVDLAAPLTRPLFLCKSHVCSKPQTRMQSIVAEMSDSPPSRTPAITTPDVRNFAGCRVKYSEGRGRGVFGAPEACSSPCVILANKNTTDLSYMAYPRSDFS